MTRVVGMKVDEALMEVLVELTMMNLLGEKKTVALLFWPCR
jgi:hypothetical protein